jgi:3-methyl-2-oxobutanoate hydroxymethyltransferase
MIHHTKAVRRGVKRAFLIADMPFGSYHVSCHEGLAHATRFVKEAGAEAVKIEGGEKRLDLINKILDAEIPVCGHIGLTPQSVHKMGGYRVQGKTLKAVEQLMRDAVELDRAGVCLLVLEGIPREVAAMITHEVHTPTIGIGAGPECDGQILVFHDLVNLSFGPTPKFVRHYADAGALIGNAVKEYCADIRSGAFPADSESYHLPQETQEALQIVTSRRAARK